jgi:hypothetical protein
MLEKDDDTKMDAIAHHTHLHINNSGPRYIKYFTLQLVLPLHIVTTEEVYGVEQ